MLQALDEAFEKKSWHGTNLRGSLRGITAEQAAWRPAPGRHSIQEIVVHAAYWKHVLHRSISGAKRGGFALKGHDWFSREGADEAAWKADIALLIEEHRVLRSAIEAIDPKKLDHIARKKYTIRKMVHGAAAHDLYHAGQIQLLKRLRP